MYTTLPYLYRDASNYKAHAEIVLEGQLSADELALIASKLQDGEYFIPADLQGLDLDELQGNLSTSPTDDDHPWHTLLLGELSVSSEPPAQGTSTHEVADFVAAFAAISGPTGWDEMGAMERFAS